MNKKLLICLVSILSHGCGSSTSPADPCTDGDDQTLCDGKNNSDETVCGDGVKAGTEACDDGDTDGGDGCSGICEIENGWSCDGQQGCVIISCAGNPCQNGTCDNGASSSGYTCTCEDGWIGAQCDVYLMIQANYSAMCLIKNGKLACGSSSSDLSSIGTSVTWRSITIGYNHYCGIDNDNSLYCWGSNTYGQLGVADTYDRQEPTKVSDEWRMVSLGSAYSCGIKADGKLFCWGDGSSGQTGIEDEGGGALSSSTPLQVGAASDWTAISAGESHACGIRVDGTNRTLWCWGSNGSGQLGLGFTATPIIRPQQVNYEDWTAISAGRDHTCGIRESGTLYCWGKPDNGKLGLGTAPFGDTTMPVQVGNDAWLFVSAGENRTCGVRDNGNLYCWGVSSVIPTQLSTAETWRAVSTATGGENSCGIKDATPYCWTSNSSSDPTSAVVFPP